MFEICRIKHMYMKKIIYLVSMLLFISCVTTYKTLNNAKAIEFKDKKEYATYFQSKYGIDENKIYFLDKESAGDFFRYINEQGVSYFYGITLNDSLKINDPYLNEMSSCSGRVSQIINEQGKQYNTITTKLTTFNFKDINQNKLDISKGKSVIFLVSTQFGKSINETIKDLSEETAALNNPDINYYYLTVDNLSIRN